MHSSGNICKRIAWIAGFFLLSTGEVPVRSDVEKALEIRWRFPQERFWEYRLVQTARIQNYYPSDPEKPDRRSPVHTETTQGVISLKTLDDGNTYGDIVLELKDIREKNQSLLLSEAQKIPQKVCRFIMSADGTMEQYSGPLKETYIITRLILGVPLQRMKLNEVRVFPFSIYTDRDESRSPMTGTISHELRSLERHDNRSIAQIVTTIDLVDRSTEGKVIENTWKGTGTSLFDIDTGCLETASWSIAQKQKLSGTAPEEPNMIVQIFDITAARSNRSN
ncbi:hypothetical protein JXA80_03695 [bacterium]|nr:hypothetical protein [candidate division CSSED10-310 bacterium]